MKSILTDKQFYEIIEKYLINQSVVLAYSSASKYNNLVFHNYVKVIEVYVEDFLTDLDSKLINQIKIESFDNIEYKQDNLGIKCTTEEQTIYDLIKRCDSLKEKKIYAGIVGEELCEAIDTYDIIHKKFPKYNNLTINQEKCFNYYKTLILKLRNEGCD